MIDPKECTHEKVTPTVTDEQLKGLDAGEVRARYPRFVGKCPDCGTELIAYASRYHYMAGDW